jgi:hypothetical protein
LTVTGGNGVTSDGAAVSGDDDTCARAIPALTAINVA